MCAVNVSSNDDWLNLSKAAELLGVHPSTLRAWADKEKLPSHRTPGGHRRFRRHDLEEWAQVQRSGPVPGPVRVVQATLGRARMEIGTGNLATQAWYTELSDAARREHREIGRELLALLQRYLAEPTERASILDGARVLGERYYALGDSSGLPLTDSLRAFLYFRDFLFETVVEMMDADEQQENWREVYQLTSRFTNEMLVALVAADKPGG